MEAQLKALQQQVQSLQAEVAELKAQQAAAKHEHQKLEAQAAELSAKVKQQQPAVNIGGYMQTRWTSDDSSSADNAITIPRARLKFAANPTEKASFKGEIDIGKDNKPHRTKDLYMQYKLDEEWMLRVGQTKVPLGRARYDSDQTRCTLERAEVFRKMLPTSDGRDRGLFLYKNSTGPWDPDFRCALYNGQGPNTTDKNGRKNYALWLNVPAGGGLEFGGSWANGSYVDGTGHQTAQNFETAHIRYASAPWTYAVEYVRGRKMGNSIDGWYARTTYDLNPKTRLYLRVDGYDPARDTAGNYWHGYTAGVNFFLDDKTKLTVEAEHVQNDAGCTQQSYNMYATQLQLSF